MLILYVNIIAMKNKKNIIKKIKGKTITITRTKTKKIKIRKNKKKVNSIYDGGAAFVKGGFGCVFKPALNCKDSELNTPPNYVSKLIGAKHGKREYMYISNIKKRLEHLPENIKKYFLLDNVSMCEPKPLTEQDKVKIEEVCDYILTDNKDKTTQEPITSQNINNNLDKFKIINMPELSISLIAYIKKKKLTPIELVNLNNNIIEYLTTVIPALYKNGVVHGDIKPDNLMFNMSDNNTLVVIDWGLSYVLDNDRKNVPEALYTLGTQWHHPFSSFLFKKHVTEKYDTLLQKFKKEGVKVTRDNLQEFAMSEYKTFMSKHEKQFLFLNETFMSVYGEELSKKLKQAGRNDIENYMYNLIITYIVEYIIDVLLTYTVDYKLEMGRYFYEVYLLNADTWGIMSTYSELIESIPLMNNITSVERKTVTRILMKILTHNLYKNGGKVINMPKLIYDIEQLNKYLMSISIRTSHKESDGKVRSSAVSAMDLKKSMVDKRLMKNKIVYDKLYKYSNKSRGRLPNVQVAVVTGGYKTRKNRKNRKNSK
jgi:serine/threonine protein kinase